MRSTDPRVRVATCLLLVVTGALLSAWPLLLALAGAGLWLTLSAGMRPATVLRRHLWLLWFTGLLCLSLPLAVPTGGLALALRVGLRALACFEGALALSASAPLPELLRTMEWLHVPRLFLMVGGMGVRYIDVLREEARRQAISRRSRCYRPAGSLWSGRTLRSAAHSLGALLLRAFDRSERIYHAMLGRGYSLAAPRRQGPPLPASGRWAIGLAALAAGGLLLLDRVIQGGLA